jgi:hypothetical protein
MINALERALTNVRICRRSLADPAFVQGDAWALCVIECRASPDMRHRPIVPMSARSCVAGDRGPAGTFTTPHDRPWMSRLGPNLRRRR